MKQTHLAGLDRKRRRSFGLMEDRTRVSSERESHHIDVDNANCGKTRRL